MRRVRVSQSRGTIERVPRGRLPKVDLELGENQRVVNFEATNNEVRIDPERKTVDWRWTAWIATDLGEVPA